MKTQSLAQGGSVISSHSLAATWETGLIEGKHFGASKSTETMHREWNSLAVIKSYQCLS